MNIQNWLALKALIETEVAWWENRSEDSLLGDSRVSDYWSAQGLGFGADAAWSAAWLTWAVQTAIGKDALCGLHPNHWSYCRQAWLGNSEYYVHALTGSTVHPHPRDVQWVPGDIVVQPRAWARSYPGFSLVESETFIAAHGDIVTRGSPPNEEPEVVGGNVHDRVEQRWISKRTSNVVVLLRHDSYVEDSLSPQERSSITHELEGVSEVLARVLERLRV